MPSFSDVIDAPASPNIYLDSLIGNRVFAPDYFITFILQGLPGDRNLPGGQGDFGGPTWARDGAALAFRQAVDAWNAVANIGAEVLPFPYAEGGERSVFTFVEEIGPIEGDTIAEHDLPAAASTLGGRFDPRVEFFTAQGNARGGLGFTTFLHEIGHALGLVHPHADIYANDVRFPGVVSSSDTGDNGLNQGLFTVMTYNDGYNAIGVSPSYGYGWQATPMAFDIAAVQLIYGRNMATGAGSNRYELPTANGPGTFLSAIWDSGGVDTIVYAGSGATTIDLRAATLRNEPGGGGFLSSATGIFGGFTIANGVVIENAIGGSGADTIIGNDAANRIEGGGGGDRIDSGAGDDQVFGGGGDDRIDPGAGDDQVFGGDGDDNLIGGTGDDALSGDAGNDILFGGAGTNRLDGGAGNDNITGGDQDDTLIGGPGDDVLYANDGDDILRPGDGRDFLAGAGGYDTADYSDATAGKVISLSGQFETGIDTIFNIERVIGTAFDDRIVASSLDDLIDGGAGGADTLDGGAGFDTLTHAAARSAVTIDLARAISFDGEATDRFVNFERVIGSPFADTITGSQAADFLIEGGAGADTIISAGRDTVGFGSAARGVIVDLDVGLSLDSGSLDRLIGVRRVLGSAFDDLIFGSETLNDTIDGGAGADTLAGGGGRDLVSYASAARAVTVDLVLGTGSDGRATDRLSGFEGVIGSAHEDHIFGTEGDDFFIGGAQTDEIVGRGGVDTVSYADAPLGVAIDLRAGRGFDGTAVDVLIGIENIIGSAGNDDIQGSDLDNVIDGGTGGADMLQAHGGVDTLTYATAARGIEIALAFTIANDGVEQDRIFGFENVIGSAFADVIIADDAANVVDGGAGGDTLDGGAGVDTLSYASATRGVIIDLNAGAAFDGALDSFTGFERVIGSAFDDLIFGSETLGDLIDPGQGGRDTIAGGGGGIDTLTYAASRTGVIIDLSVGLAFDGASLDTYSGIEVIVASRFADTIFGSEGADVIEAGAGADSISGGGGLDTLLFTSAPRGVIVDLNAGATWDGESGDRLSSIERVVGSAFDDLVFGSETQGDIIDGGAGGRDTLAGGGGVDTVSYAASARGVIIDLSAGASFDGVAGDALSGFENATGSMFADQIFGDSGANLLDGGAGADRLLGGPGADRFLLRRGDAEGDVVIEFSGAGGDGDRLVLAGFAPGSTLAALAPGDYAIIDAADGAMTRFQLAGAPLTAADYLFG